MRDDRVRHINTADAIAWQHRRLPLFVFKSDNARAIYVFGRRVKQTGWIVDHPEPFRSAYKRHHKAIEHILREPNPFELYDMLPAFHPLERKDGKPVTAGEYLDFTHKAWKAKQVSDIVRMIQQAEAQYIRDDYNDINRVTQLEIIDRNGRTYAAGFIPEQQISVDLSYQNNGKKLKVFVKERK